MANDNMNGINPYFDSCGYANDFEAFIDIHCIIPSIPEGAFDIWLKAYDTSCRETENERYLNDSGYAFECCAAIMDYDGNTIIGNVEPRPATDKDDAEKMLVNMAWSIMKDRNLVNMMKDMGEKACV